MSIDEWAEIRELLFELGVMVAAVAPVGALTVAVGRDAAWAPMLFGFPLAAVAVFLYLHRRDARKGRLR